MTTPTDQRAGVKPIAFALDDNGVISEPVTLPIRPEDLTRSEPSRSAVHQTLGREIMGWVDNFGPGLPTININGHTGWRTAAGSGLDGVQAFHALNDLVHVQYHKAKQRAVDTGIDPAAVKLIFVDMLDDFAVSVVPLQFSLKRSRSSPLLVRYNIAMQAISTEIDSVTVELPQTGNPSNGLLALDRSVKRLEEYAPEAVDAAEEIGGGSFSDLVGGFIGLANDAFRAVVGFVRGINDLATSAASRVIGFASDLAGVGLNLFRAMNAIRGLPTGILAQVSRVAAAFNELICIFANSLRPRPVYQDYNGLYGASNCSSTVGGRPYSPYENLNVFSRIVDSGGSMSVSSEAATSISALKNMDPVLSPMPPAEIERHMGVIMAGVA
jgi:hypothetical protein